MSEENFKHIIVFERRSGMRQLICEIFEELGYRVTLAHDVEAAHHALDLGDVDLLITEITQRFGDEQIIAERAATLGLPCVLLSEPKSEKSNLQAIAVHKPLTLQKLGETVIEVLKSQQGYGDG